MRLTRKLSRWPTLAIALTIAVLTLSGVASAALMGHAMRPNGVAEGGVVIDGVALPAEIIPGYQVIGAITPQQDPCQPVPVLYLQGPYENAETTFNNGDFPRLQAALEQLGLGNVQLSVGGGPGGSLYAQRQMIQQWVQSDVDQFQAWGHCLKSGGPGIAQTPG